MWFFFISALLFALTLSALLIYPVAGRSVKARRPEAYKKGFIIILVCVALTLGLAVGGTVRVAMNSDLVWESIFADGEIFMFSTETYVNNQWTVAARNANGHRSMTATLDEAELAIFHVTSRSERGSLQLHIRQGELEKVLDISDAFNESIDMSGFHPGQINLLLEFVRADHASVEVSWRGHAPSLQK